jgi:hypothetical protein
VKEACRVSYNEAEKPKALKLGLKEEKKGRRRSEEGSGSNEVGANLNGAVL